MRQTDSMTTLLALAAQFPATLHRIMERDSEYVTLATLPGEGSFSVTGYNGAIHTADFTGWSP